jgi:hypothetical protein
LNQPTGATDDGSGGKNTRNDTQGHRRWRVRAMTFLLRKLLRFL